MATWLLVGTVFDKIYAEARLVTNILTINFVPACIQYTYTLTVPAISKQWYCYSTLTRRFFGAKTIRNRSICSHSGLPFDLNMTITGKRKRDEESSGNGEEAKKAATSQDTDATQKVANEAEVTPQTSEGEKTTKASDAASVEETLRDEGAATYELLFCGSTKWHMIGRKSVPKSVQKRGGQDTGTEVWTPSVVGLEELGDVRVTGVYSGATAAHFVLVDAKGRAWGVGRNESGQLGVAEPVAAHVPLLLALKLGDGERVVDAVCARHATYVRTSGGTVWAAGLNVRGELGVGGGSGNGWRGVLLPSGEKCVSVSAGAEFALFATESGALYAAGSAQYGQLGDGRGAGLIVSSKKLEYETQSTPQRVNVFGGKDQPCVKKVACGAHHALALDNRGRVWSWGWGAYGRLGHRVAEDEGVPRIIDTISHMGAVTDIGCGASCSMAYIAKRKQLFYWGISRTSGESTMYPKPIHDLTGWECRSFALGPTSAVVAADDEVIAWGGSPTFGELGYGKGNQKSSTRPKEIDSLSGLRIARVAMGLAFTVMLASPSNDEERKTWDSLDNIALDDA